MRNRAGAAPRRPARWRRTRRRRACGAACPDCRAPARNAARNSREAARCRTPLVPIDGYWPRWATRSSIVASAGCSAGVPGGASAFGSGAWSSAGGEPATGSTTASSGSSRGSTAAIVRPSGSTAGMSLLLCTARSISPLSNASSSSLTNSRFPPTSESGASCSRSPDVLMITRRHRGPPSAAMRLATAFACHKARWLPRVPRRSSCGCGTLSASSALWAGRMARRGWTVRDPSASRLATRPMRRGA